MRGTLGQRLAWRDEARFVGREAELALFDEVLATDPSASIVFVHGPGGVGKSTLLREIARRGEKRGFLPCVVEGRDLAPVPGELETALQGFDDHERPLILFDTYERMAAAGGWLRQSLLPALPEGAVVVIAGRRPPEPGWTQDGWERLTLQVELKPLLDEEAAALVTRHGVDDTALVGRIVRWAQGSPLALALGADAAAQRGSDLHLAELDEDPDLARTLLQRLAQTELDGARPRRPLRRRDRPRDERARCCATRFPTSTRKRPTRSCAGSRSPRSAAAAWRCTSACAAPCASMCATARVSVSASCAGAIADHLHRRAVAGEPSLCVDLAALSENSAVRWGFGAEGSVTHRVDDLRDADVVTLQGLMLRRYGGPEYWTAMQELLEAAVERVVVVRDRDDRLAGLSISVTPDNAPAGRRRRHHPRAAGWPTRAPTSRAATC